MQIKLHREWLEMKAYTYRCGEKIELNKSATEMVVRALPHELDDISMLAKERVSSASTRINVDSAELESLMARTRTRAVAHHAYYDAQSGSEFLITDRVLLTFKDGVSPYEVDQLAGRYDLSLVRRYDDNDYVYRLTDATGMNPLKLIIKLNEDESIVDLAEHDLNHRIRKYSFEIPDDPNYLEQWHLHNRFHHHAVDPRSSSRCEEAWQLLDGFGNRSVVIAVSDDGCKLDHRDFDSGRKFSDWVYMDRLRLVHSFAFDANPDDMYTFGSNHGTSCCGVVAGEKDSELTVGAAPNCQLLPIKWEATGEFNEYLDISDTKLKDVLLYISDKVDVMSNSWGFPVTSIWPLQVVNLVTQLAQTGGRRGKGILFLWAAGNENCPINEITNQDVPYTSGYGWINGTEQWVGVDTARQFRNNLVDIPGVMHIAALASTAKRSHYSNYGSGISLTAPSSNSHTYWRMFVGGRGITTATGSNESFESPFSITRNFGGTSSATPLVAGIAGLCISANPDLTAIEIEALLKATASKDLNFEVYPRTPPSGLDPDTSWDVSPVAPHDRGDFQDLGLLEGSWSPWFGHGCVNAEAAVAEALARSRPASNLLFTDTSTPQFDIPDADTQGVQDHITVHDSFELTGVKVTVDIQHTFIGDLSIQLISPAGTTVQLHNRNGGGTNDLNKTYDASTTPQLQQLTGENVRGDWRLYVRDLANIDIGRLLSWSLELNGQLSNVLELEDTAALTIPDDSTTGISRTLQVNEIGSVKVFEIDLDITHTFIGDLVVELMSPSGTKVLLHNFSGGSNDNIINTFTFNNTPQLQILGNEEIQGDWVLHVSDHASRDIGKLNRWAIRIDKK